MALSNGGGMDIPQTVLSVLNNAASITSDNKDARIRIFQTKFLSLYIPNIRVNN